MSYEDFSQEQTEKLTNLLTSMDSDEFDKEAVKGGFKELLDKQAEYGKTQYIKTTSKVKKYQDVLAKIGYDPEAYDNADEFVNQFKQKVESVDTKTTEYTETLQRLKKLEAERDAEKAQSDKLKAQNERNTIENKLTEELGVKLKGSKYIIKDIINEGKVKLIDGEVMFVDGEDVVLFSNGIQKILDENSDLIVADIKGGVGVLPKGERGRNQSSLTLEMINKMTPEQRRANMSEIKKMANLR